MTITHDTMTVETVLQRRPPAGALDLRPSRRDRDGPPSADVDLIDELRAAGCFRLVRPATHGGLEASVARRNARRSSRWPGPTPRSPGP